MDSTLSIGESLKLATEYISGDSMPQDYEQAVFLLSQIAADSQDAADLLETLSDRGLGIERSAPSSSGTSFGYVPDFDKFAKRSQGLEPNTNRCINCGDVGTLKAHDANALICGISSGGCGAIQDIVISETGLSAGMAIEPYTLEPGARSYMGSQINTLKYDSSIDADDASSIIGEIADRIRECAILDRLVPATIQNDLVIVPVPSSKRRKVQPVYELAMAIAGDRFTYSQALMKHAQTESKSRRAGSELAEGEITCKSGFAANNVLLLDDTYGEGATSRACIRALQRTGVENIYLLTLCKNTFGGVKS